MSRRRNMLRLVAGAVVLAGAWALATAGAAMAQDVKTYTKKGSYDDVRTDLTEAVVSKGLKIDYNGKIGDMLDRTGADVGSAKPIYKKAEFFTFCSAKLSRAMMEADAANIASCPYVVFVYENADKPGEIVVGYRKTIQQGNAKSKAALAEIDKLLDAIAKDAVK